MQTWEDDQLGIFKFDRYEWSRMFELPAFSVFRYDGIEKHILEDLREKIIFISGPRQVGNTNSNRL